MGASAIASERTEAMKRVWVLSGAASRVSTYSRDPFEANTVSRGDGASSAFGERYSGFAVHRRLASFVLRVGSPLSSQIDVRRTPKRAEVRRAGVTHSRNPDVFPEHCALLDIFNDSEGVMLRVSDVRAWVARISHLDVYIGQSLDLHVDGLENDDSREQQEDVRMFRLQQSPDDHDMHKLLRPKPGSSPCQTDDLLRRL